MHIAKIAKQRKRIRQLSIGLVAVLSLFVSAVSACACSHHQPPKTAIENSCHGSIHTAEEAPIAAGGPVSSFDADCNCFVRASVPAIISKSGEKKNLFGKEIAVVENLFVAFSLEYVFDSDDASLSTDLPVYTPHYFAYRPSRAPPRL
ncbi:MAG: hypothetical protein ACT4O9_02550 [Blastocatellia bacterium]